MYQLVLILHVIIAVAIIALVLVQHGKGADMGAAFGAGASQTVFGSAGSGSFLLKVTGGLAAGFFITSLSLGSIASHDYKQAREISIPVQQETSSPIPIPTVPQSKQEAKQQINNELDENKVVVNK